MWSGALVFCVTVVFCVILHAWFGQMMTTGLHTVYDIFCVACGAIFECLHLRRTRGKFIMEKNQRSTSWSSAACYSPTSRRMAG